MLVKQKISLTYDQGNAMSDHHRFTIDINIDEYFAHTGSH